MSGPPEHRPTWHTLLAPLPAEAMPVRKPIGQNLSLNRSAGTFGLRHLLIVLDETGRPIAASDLVAEIVLRAG